MAMLCVPFVEDLQLATQAQDRSRLGQSLVSPKAQVAVRVVAHPDIADQADRTRPETTEKQSANDGVQSRVFIRSWRSLIS